LLFRGVLTGEIRYPRCKTLMRFDRVRVIVATLTSA
jgi:hypothetical protein